MFAFLLAVLEVNAKLMLDHLHQRKETDSQMAMLEFRKQLVKELLNNPYRLEGVEEERRNLRRRVTIPEHGDAVDAKKRREPIVFVIRQPSIALIALQNIFVMPSCVRQLRLN